MDIGTLLRSAVQPLANSAGRTAVSLEGQNALTYAQLYEKAQRYANGLLSLGAAPGDRVGLLMYNSVEYWAAYFATVQIGCIAVRLNFRLSADELDYALRDSGASLLCVSGDLITQVEPVAHALGVTTVHLARGTATPPRCQPWAALEAASAAELDVARPSAQTPAMLMYTSGTTGRPKGALWSHGNTAWIAAMQAIKWKLDESTVALTTGPMYHVGAFEDLLLPTLLVGGHAIVCRSTGFEIGRIIDLMADHGVTDVFLYPFMIYELLRHPRLPQSDLGALRRIITGGSPIAAWAVRALAEQLPRAGLSSAYGLTEGGAMSTVLDPADLRDHPEAVGRPLPMTEVRVVDEHGLDAAPGGDGEIWVRSPSVGQGYWNQPDANAQTFIDGWCHTGDRGRITSEPALLQITGREKEMIKSGGENIYPAELERLLAEHAEVLECAVIGVDDDRLQEAVCAVVVRADGSDLSSDDVIAYCAERIARYKRPRHVVFLDALPRNAAGKVLKRDLKESLVSRTAHHV